MSCLRPVVDRLPVRTALLLASLLVVAGSRPAGAADAEAWLRDDAGAVGLDFRHETRAAGELAMPEIMSGGVALLDVDGDGRLDVYFTSGARNRMFRQTAERRFADVTTASGLGDTGYGMGVAVGDVDNDGDVDVYVANVGLDRLYRNRGDGTFEDATEAAGIRVDGWSSSAGFFDYDRDGFLDLYVGRYVRYNPGKHCRDAAGRPDYCSPSVFAPEPDVLLHNRGDGTFEDVSEAAGIRRAFGAALGVVVVDLDDDGWADVYVANDGSANQLWINGHDGRFEDRALLRGAAYNLDGEAEAGMGVVAADLDGDLDLDLFLTHLSDETNTLYRNLGGARGFEDATGAAGLTVGSLPLTGFGVAAVDLELDGDLDLVVADGRVSGGPRGGADDAWRRFAQPNRVWTNDGAGRFSSSADCGGFTAGIEVSRGLAAGDVDDDGDVDFVLVNGGGAAELWRNTAPRRGRWLEVRAVDPRLKRDALGARIVAVGTDGRRRLGVVTSASSYQSSGDARVHFGLGTVAALARLEVRWPDGLVESFAVPGVDRELRVERGAGGKAP